VEVGEGEAWEAKVRRGARRADAPRRDAACSMITRSLGSERERKKRRMEGEVCLEGVGIADYECACRERV
jgi:hypothetical protein